MSKKLAAFRLSQEALDLLVKIAEKHERSQAYILDKLIKEAAKKEKITLT